LRALFDNGKRPLSWHVNSYYSQLFIENGLGRYNVVHSHCDPRFIKICSRAQRKNRKWIHSYHSLYFLEDTPAKILDAGQEKVNRALIDTAKNADLKICVSKWLADFLSTNYSIETTVIPNGVDVSTCEKANPHRFMRMFGVKEFILFVGYLDYIKNPLLFVQLAQSMPEQKFVMIGRNFSRSNLKKEYGVNTPDNLVLISELEHDSVLDAISACKVYVMTSKRETCPTSLLEAMALKKTVVVPSHSGCKEIVQSSEFGYLYEPDSLKDLIEKTAHALDFGTGMKARERISNVFDWRVLIKKIDSAYDCLR
jgi:glycosyltransferase involved in cell wall biosynthesis